MTNIATTRSIGAPPGGEHFMFRRESLSPALGLGLASFISFLLWAVLLNVVHWIAGGLF